MNRYAITLAALCSLGVAALAPTAARAQPAPTQLPGQGATVAVQEFTGNASDEYLRNVASTARGSLIARGSVVAPASRLNEAIGVSPPSGTVDLARRIQSAGITHLLQGTVRLLVGQYTLTLTLVEGGTGRSATQERIVHEENAGETVAAMLDALFAPNALGPPPPDPDAVRREEEARRQREEEARRQQEADAARRAEAERTAQERAAREARERAAREAAETRAFDQRGPLAIGLGMQLGGRVSEGRAAPTNLLTGTAPSDPSAFAYLLRAEVGYSIRAVRGLEVLGAIGVMTSPTTAFLLGGGAQYTFPVTARLPIRASAGVTLGLYQGISGARTTTAWITPFARAEYTFGASPWSAFAGLALDIAPAGDGGVTTLSLMLGARFRVAP